MVGPGTLRVVEPAVRDQEPTTDARHWVRGDPAWVRTIVGWHVAFWAMWGIATVTVLVGGADGDRAMLGLVPLSLLGAAYLLLGTPAARQDRGGRAAAYLVVLCLTVPLVVAADRDGTFLLFVAYPQVWFFARGRRDGALATVTLTLLTGLALLSHTGTDPAALRSVGVSMAISLLFSLALGLWIASVIDQSEQRGELIAELDATRARLADAHHEQGVLAERERMAQEIHDTLAQGFTSVVTLSQAAQSEIVRDPAAAVARLSAIEATARENLAEARALVAAFSPVPLQDSTLAEALGRLADRFAAETGLIVRFELDAGRAPSGEPLAPLTRDREVVLLRAAQEALANVRRHAGASSVVLRLHGGEDGTWVEVDDDGAGFDPVTAWGFGLTGMRRRVEDVGGDVDVDSAPGRGTRVRVRVPVPEPT